MTPDHFRSLLRQHLLPLISGAVLVPEPAPSPVARPAVALRSRHSLEIKPSQHTPWCFTITRLHPFASASDGPVTEKALAKAFVEGLAAMPPGFEASPYASDLMARFGRRLVAHTLCPEGMDRSAMLAAIDQLDAWSSRSYEGHPIVAAVGFSAAGRTSSDVSLPEAWAEDFSAVLTNSFDTMLVADGNGQLLAYAAMAPPDP
ncbi:MAG: hypothetical protein ACKOPS_18395, partial [Cyanobium sp.]